MHYLAQYIGDQQSSCYGTNNDRQGLCSGFDHNTQVHTKTQQNYCPLQNLFGHKFNALLHIALIFQEQSHHHAGQNGNHGTADNRKLFS